MRILKCHCGKVEAEINIQGDLKKLYVVTVLCVNAEVRLCLW